VVITVSDLKRRIERIERLPGAQMNEVEKIDAEWRAWCKANPESWAAQCELFREHVGEHAAAMMKELRLDEMSDEELRACETALTDRAARLEAVKDDAPGLTPA
jgi:hypothetical protein